MVGDHCRSLSVRPLRAPRGCLSGRSHRRRPGSCSAVLLPDEGQSATGKLAGQALFLSSTTNPQDFVVVPRNRAVVHLPCTSCSQEEGSVIPRSGAAVGLYKYVATTSRQVLQHADGPSGVRAHCYVAGVGPDFGGSRCTGETSDSA